MAQETKKQRGRPRVERRYMEETKCYPIRLFKKDIENLRNLLKVLSAKKGKKLFASVLIKELIQKWIAENEVK